jgi:hypothetical protein
MLGLKKPVPITNNPSPMYNDASVSKAMLA